MSTEVEVSIEHLERLVIMAIETLRSRSADGQLTASDRPFAYVLGKSLWDVEVPPAVGITWLSEAIAALDFASTLELPGGFPHRLTYIANIFRAIGQSLEDETSGEVT